VIHKTSDTYTLYIDGASRNNPGPSGAGICIKKNGQLIYANGFYLDIKTNNQAEYLALLLGLYYVLKHLQPNDTLKILSDSQLLVRQILGQYKVKDIELKKIYTLVMLILSKINYTIEHVLREYNKEADLQANYAIDKKTQLDAEFINFLKKYEASFNI
jgi:ribonuclease HI